MSQVCDQVACNPDEDYCVGFNQDDCDIPVIVNNCPNLCGKC